MPNREMFQSPPAKFRGKPFWAWNGPLEEQELRRQIRVFKEMGLGGAFMHSRVGLATPYLSEEWFRLVNACADEATKNDMEAWLYDEDRWPSGAAGGLVTKDEQFRMRSLQLVITEPADFQAVGDEVAVFEARLDGAKVTSMRRLSAGAAPAAGKALVFRIRLTDPSPWYNDQTYLDTLNPEAVKRFIEVTHEAYGKHTLSKYPNTIVPGIFTDEPNYDHAGRKVSDTEYRTSWTGILPAVFKDRYGYDILDHLPEIFFQLDGAEFSSVRRDYYDCLTFLFTDSFGRLIGEWCEQNGIAYTGHVLAEESLVSQTMVVGTAMRFYPYMQAPGIDILCGQSLERPGGGQMELSTAKQCHSVAHQFGRKWMLSELYGCTGWQFTFAEHKAVGDWQAAMGVNLRCQHLAWYTGLGEAKRDYPASISYQSSWYREYSLVEDYFARVGVALSEGEVVRDVAVIHPIESCWAVATPGAMDTAWTVDRNFKTTQAYLLEEHFDFDYVDEDLLARYGSVQDETLRVNKAAYRVVVVPPTLTLRQTTVQFMEAFVKAGGKVVFIAPVSPRVDCAPSEAVSLLTVYAVTVPLDSKAIADALIATGKVRRVSIATADGQQFRPALYMMRQDATTGKTVLFICNTVQSRASGPVSIATPAHGQAQEWDAVTGQRYLATSVETADGVVIETDLPAYGSRLFVIDPEPDKTLQPRPDLAVLSTVNLAPTTWPIQLDGPNAMPLDRPEYSLDGGDWQGPEEILRLDGIVRDAAGLRRRGGGMVQPWAQTTPPSARNIGLKLRYTFDVEAVPTGLCNLVLEQSARYEVAINGKPILVPSAPTQWIDNSFDCIPVPADVLRTGANEVVLTTQYGVTHGLECVYFTGEFGAKWQGLRAVITPAPTTLSLGDWTTQGLPCYTDSVSYTTDVQLQTAPGEHTFLELPEWNGVLVRVTVNGEAVGAVSWPPYELDITGAVKAGVNRIEIKVMASRRNLLGPLHCATVYPGWTGPGEYVTSGEQWTDEYVKIPYGLMKPPVISTRV